MARLSRSTVDATALEIRYRDGPPQPNLSVRHRRRRPKPGVEFWSAALDATDEPLLDVSNKIYRRLRLLDSDIRILLQRTNDPKLKKERMHLDVETDDVEAEVDRLEGLGAKRWNHQQERGFEL